jgi:hypothetical protein
MTFGKLSFDASIVTGKPTISFLVKAFADTAIVRLALLLCR